MTMSEKVSVLMSCLFFSVPLCFVFCVTNMKNKIYLFYTIIPDLVFRFQLCLYDSNETGSFLALS